MRTKKDLSFYVNETPAGSLLKTEALSNHYSKRNLGTTVVENGYVLPSKGWHGEKVDGGVVDCNRTYVPTSGLDETSSFGYDFEEPDAISNGICLYLGLFHVCYGHAITDALQKLWWTKTEECKQMLMGGGYFCFITASNKDMPTWHLRILELAGIDTSQLHHIRKITKFKKIVIPDNSKYNDNKKYYTDEFKWQIESIKKSVGGTSVYKNIYPKNVYFTRTGIKNRGREMGEKSVENTFRKKGFAVYSPERMTIDEQVAILMKCDRFAATEGSVSHAAIFMHPESEAIILRKADYVNHYTAMIADMVGNRTTIIDIHHSTNTNKDLPMLGPFFLYVTQELQTYLGLQTIYPPYWMIPSFWWYKLRDTWVGNIIRRIVNKIRNMKKW